MFAGHTRAGWLALSWLWVGVAFGQAAPAPAPASAVAPAPADVAASAAQPPLAADDPARTRAAIVEALAEGNEPLDSNRAAELARQTSPSLRSARAATARARAAASQAFVAVYPRVDAAFNYKRMQDREGVPFTDTNGDPVSDPITGDPVTLPTPLLNQYGFRIDVNYPLSSVFLAALPRHQAAKLATEYQDMLASAQQHDVALAAREAYFEYARSRAFLVVGRDGLANAEAHRADVEKLVNAGVQARVELMRADARVASQRVAVNVAERNEAVARTALLSLLHLPSDRQPIIKDDFSAAEPALDASVDKFVEEAYQRRTELRALERLVDSYMKTKQSQFGGRLPVLGVGAQVNISTKDQMNNIASVGTGFWQVTAWLSWSPNDYAINGYAMNQTIADIERANADMQSFRDRVRLEVTQAWEAHESGRLAEESARAGVIAAEESYRVRREQYKAGAAVGTEVNDAETELRRAQLELVAAVVDIKLARVRLDRALER